MRAVAVFAVPSCLAVASLPPLQPGEALAVADRRGEVQLQGDARRAGPLGDLACLPWLRLEGFVWGSSKVDFHCKGQAGDLACTTPKGHGRLDLRRAFERNCRLALLAWIRASAVRWEKLEGSAIARLRLLETFGPFLGKRLPAGEALPAFGLAWAGAGDLLQASPESLAGWLADPAQETAASLFQRYGAGFFEGTFSAEPSWAYVGGAEGAEGPATWVVVGRREAVAVLRLPGAQGREQALRRAEAILRESRR